MVWTTKNAKPTLEKRSQIDADSRTDLAGYVAVLNFIGLYVVNRSGTVRSLDRYIPQGSRWGHPVMKLHHGRELTPFTTKTGRQVVVLHDHQHHRHCRQVDHLVREAFGAAAESRRFA